MLVLSRKIGERIVVGFGNESVTIEVLKIAGKRVRIGVIAPLCIPVHREELRDRIKENGGGPVVCPDVTATSRNVA